MFGQVTHRHGDEDDKSNLSKHWLFKNKVEFEKRSLGNKYPTEMPPVVCRLPFDFRTPRNESLLLLAIRHKLERVADQLCELLGSDISTMSAAAGGGGNTPLWVALRSRQLSIASKLVRCGKFGST